MARTSEIRLRRSAAQLHALEEVEREIRASDPHTHRKYLREYAEAFTEYEAVLTAEQTAIELLRADILLVGDYHALPRCQQFAAELVEQSRSSGREVILGLETIFARDQDVVDQWQRGEIGEEELRQRIRHDLEWGYDWEPTRELLVRARSAGARVCGLDCRPRGDLRRIHGRDKHAAVKIAEIRAEQPVAVIVVLFGESHLAPQHLPKLVRLAAPHARVVSVLQNVDALFWKVSGEPADSLPAVRVNADTICVFNTSPLEKYESYRLCLDHWRRERPGRPDVAPMFYNLVEALHRFLKIDRCARASGPAVPLVFPQVVLIDAPESLRCTLGAPRQAYMGAGPSRTLRISDDEVEQIQDRLSAAGLCYTPVLNTLLVREFNLRWAAEEAARFLCASGWGDIGLPGAAREGEDAFYRACVQQALVEYGARVLCPGREQLREQDLYSLYGEHRGAEEPSRLRHRDHLRVVDFIVVHRDFECNARRYRLVPELIREGRNYTGKKRELATQWLGRLLGCELYDAYLKGDVGKRSLRSLFAKPLDQPKAVYFRLARLCRQQRTRFSD